MPGVDWIPGLSQMKTVVQLATGDVEGAARTHENFLRECPVVSQLTSTVQLIAGDAKGALETQKRCLSTVNNVANGIPVFGHVKGIIHHIVGDHEGGNQALNAATRSTVVFGTGAVAAVTTGGIAAIPVAIAAGAGYDAAATIVTEQPQGYIAAIGNAIENPSAGSIFDAAAIVAGDGLAGYSGGQIAKQMTSQIKLNNLEAVRTAKTDQLHAGMFEEAGGGGGGGMTSGQLHSLGKSINSLTAEIDAIRGTPQYWYDLKSGKITLDKPKSSTAVPIVGYTNNENDASSSSAATSTPIINPEIFAMQESGILSDSYVDATVTKDNKNVKLVLLMERLHQKPSERTLGEAYPKVKFTTRYELENLKKGLQPNKHNRKWKRVPGNYLWLYVQMPRQFNYTGVIMLNDPFRGLLHSFIRHSDQWQHYIPGVNDLLDEMSTLEDELLIVRIAYDDETSTAATQEYIKARKLLTYAEYIAAQEAAMDAQIDMHRFIQDNITYENYLGEGANSKHKEQVYFEVRNNRGQRQVMVVCVSDQLFPADAAFPDGRPVRTITSVFFISWNDYKSRHVTKKY